MVEIIQAQEHRHNICKEWYERNGDEDYSPKNRQQALSQAYQGWILYGLTGFDLATEMADYDGLIIRERGQVKYTGAGRRENFWIENEETQMAIKLMLGDIETDKVWWKGNKDDALTRIQGHYDGDMNWSGDKAELPITRRGKMNLPKYNKPFRWSDGELMMRIHRTNPYTGKPMTGYAQYRDDGWHSGNCNVSGITNVDWAYDPAWKWDGEEIGHGIVKA